MLKDVDNADQINIAVKNIYGLSKERADFIANVEFKNLTNSARVAIAKESDKVAGVLVSDGTEFDSPCINANGQIWSLEYAGDNVLEHINCVRQFTYVTQKEVDDNGGFDEE